MAGKQKLWTPLDYVHYLAGWPPPENEPEVQQVPVPTPVYMPNPRTIDESAMFGMDGGYGGPALPPPIAPPPPDGFSGGGGMFFPDDSPFG